jgi:glycosyltransferase involved in cell wall biosynthesis
VRIGVMLRALEERGGIGVYAENVTRELVQHAPDDEFVLIYRTPDQVGRFAARPNVRERVLSCRSTAGWDQIGVPRVLAREGVDVVFHPKFTVPLCSRIPSVMVVHGADWLVPDQARFYGRLDVLYARTFLPLYFRRAARVISVSQLTTADFEAALALPPGKLRTVYFGPARHFARVTDPARLADVRARYRLPERFLLSLSKRGGAERKNLRGLLEGYRRYSEAIPDPLPLVIGGQDCEGFRDEYAIPEDGWGAGVRFPGWLAQADLPGIYSLAELYLYPSNLEAFPIPLTEAMACGTPIVTSNVNGLREIAGDAAVFVPPGDPRAIAEAIARVAGDPSLREALRARGAERSRLFSWDRCAEETLAILREAATARR